MADSSNPSKGGKQDKPDQPEQSSPSAKHEVNPLSHPHSAARTVFEADCISG